MQLTRSILSIETERQQDFVQCIIISSNNIAAAWRKNAGSVDCNRGAADQHGLDACNALVAVEGYGQARHRGKVIVRQGHGCFLMEMHTYV